jgi:hypothetical protein
MSFKKQMLASVAVGLFCLSGAANAIVITGTNTTSDLVDAFGGTLDGLTINSSVLSGRSSGTAISSGTFTNAAGTYGIGGGVVLSSGNVNNYNSGPNTDSGTSTGYGVGATAAQETVLDTITGGGLNHFDVTELTINFDVGLDVDEIFFNLVFGSEEFPEFAGSSFIDAFGIFLNGSNETLVGGFPINIDHPDMAAQPGTELDGVLAPNGNPLLQFALSVTPGSVNNVLTFIIADSGDASLDSTVYISGFGSVAPPPISANAPGTLALIGLGLALLRLSRRRASK